MSDDAWVFECENCGERWVDPVAPVTGHHCDWHGRGMPPADATTYDVTLVRKPEVSGDE